MGDVFTIAAVQATPVFMNREATVAKACNARPDIFELIIHGTPRRLLTISHDRDPPADPRQGGVS